MARILNPDDYTVVWIATLPIEAEAALAALDTEHNGYFLTAPGEDYLYQGGSVNGHNVLLARWAAGQNYGAVAAAALVNQCKLRFRNIKFAMLVGVAAGCPNLKPSDRSQYRDIRLGDVLVSVPGKTSTGIVQYDFGQDTGDGFVPNGRHAEPPIKACSAITIIQSSPNPYQKGQVFDRYLTALLQKAGGEAFSHPGVDTDRLFPCAERFEADAQPISREPRDPSEPTKVWYGRIGSGNSLMKNAKRRDELRDRYNLIGLEMEAAGVVNYLPTAVIKGVCDYADPYKNKEWQGYAAAVAAVYAKGILYNIHEERVSSALKPVITDVQLVTCAPSQFSLFSRELLEENTNGMYWEHVSIAWLTTYEQTWTNLCARYGQAISFDELAQFLESATGIGIRSQDLLRSQARQMWNIVIKAWVFHENLEDLTSDLVVLPSALVAAVLYMIHMEREFPFEIRNSRRYPDLDISWDRWQLITRFNRETVALNGTLCGNAVTCHDIAHRYRHQMRQVDGLAWLAMHSIPQRFLDSLSERPVLEEFFRKTNTHFSLTDKFLEQWNIIDF